MKTLLAVWLFSSLAFAKEYSKLETQTCVAASRTSLADLEGPNAATQTPAIFDELEEEIMSCVLNPDLTAREQHRWVLKLSIVIHRRTEQDKTDPLGIR